MTPSDPQPAPVRSVIEHPRAPAQRAPRQYGLFVPQLLMTLTLAGWLGFQAFQQLGERQQLQALSASGAEVTAANRLGLSTETMGKISSIMPCHQAASRSDMRRAG